MAIFTDVLYDVTKKGKKLPTNEYKESGRYPIIDQGQNDIAGYTNETEGLFCDVPAIIFGDHTRIIKYVDTPFFIGADGVKILKAKNESANYKFLYYALSSANIPNTGYNRHFKWLKEVDIPVYTAQEQIKIVTEIDKITYLIDLRKQQLQQLDELVKARFVELFDRAENSKIYKLNDVCEEITAGGDRPKDTSEIKTEEHPYPVFANAATNEGLLCFSREYKIEKPCVTIAARGCTVGFTAIRCEKFTPVVRLITLVPNETVTPIYLKHYIDIKMNIEGNGAAQPQLTIPMIKSMEIMVPPIELQKQFATFVEQTDKSKFEIQQSLEKLETLKKALMQEYFG